MKATRGFTLIELLIALAIFALVAASAYRALDQTTSTRLTLEAEREQLEALDRAMLQLERDAAFALDRTRRNADGIEEPVLLLDPLGAILRFTRAAPVSDASIGAPVRVGYRLDGSTWVRELWPALDAAPRQQADVFHMLDGVRRIQVRARDTTGAWSDRWPVRSGTDAPAMPLQLEVTLTRTNGEVFVRKLNIGSGRIAA